MRLRIVAYKNHKYDLCPNGSKMKLNKEVLNKLLYSFKKPTMFKGNDGFWNETITDMAEAAGETLAFVDDSYKLVIISDKLFSSPYTNYISATEYAEKHGKRRPSVKNMCGAGRIEGAYKTSSGWLIPENAPYPIRKQKVSKKQINSRIGK